MNTEPIEETPEDRRACLIRRNAKQMVKAILTEADDWVIYGERSPSWEELRDAVINALFDIENERGSQDGYEAGIVDQVENPDAV